jgi:hypothetical protein
MYLTVSAQYYCENVQCDKDRYLMERGRHQEQDAVTINLFTPCTLVCGSYLLMIHVVS